ncbi:MAG: winged helix DNA-binding domain-containing protein [Egibacteraceae bacterium]
MRRIGIEERRARLGLRHHLAEHHRAADVVEAARGVVALHATDPASVFLAVAARLREATIEAIERALYDERTLVKILGMRRTMFVVPADLLPVVDAACTRAIAARERRKLIQFLEQAGIADDCGDWLRAVEEAALLALAARGGATAAQLSEDVEDLRRQIVVGEGTKWAARQRVSTRVLFLLAADGRIARGRPRGSWTSSQHRWAPMASWLPGEMAEPTAEAAQAELARRWLAAFGPGTAADLKWWTGWTVAEVKRALAKVGPVEVELDGGTGLVLADDLAPLPVPEPWVALLPALDPTVMGWSQRGWYLGEHGPALFDRSGNPGPTVWRDGRIVGGWAQRKDGQIAFRLLEDVGAAAVAATEAAADRLGAWLGATRVTPRFRTPLERELAT